MKNRTKEIFLIIVVLLAVAFLGFLAWTRKSVPSGPLPVYAPEGKLAHGFPKELILDANAVVRRSYSIDYGKANTNQKTANFTSNLTLLEIFERYKSYFKSNGWITREDVNLKTGAFPRTLTWGIYATKGANIASVVIVDDGNLREVYVTNVEKTAVVGGSEIAQTKKTEVPEALKKYFDFSAVHPYDVQTFDLRDGGKQYLVSFETGHVAENRGIIAKALEKAQFVLKDTPVEGRVFNLIGEKDSESIAAFGVSSGGESGYITIALVTKR